MEQLGPEFASKVKAAGPVAQAPRAVEQAAQVQEAEAKAARLGKENKNDQEKNVEEIQ